MDNKEIQELMEQAGLDLGPSNALHGVKDVTFEVVAKIDAIKNAGEKDERVIRSLVGPIKLSVTPSLYSAMFVLATACEVPEFKVDGNELFAMSEGVAKDLEDGKYKWASPKKK